MKNHRLPLCLAAAFGLTFTALSASASVLLDDDFSSGVRNVQDLPSQSAWFNSGSGGGTVVTDEELVFAATSRYNTTYFTDSGAQSLAVGDSLSFTYTVTTASGGVSGNNLLRIALLNSGGQRLTADNQGKVNTAFGGYVGYAFWTDPYSALAGKSSIQERNAGISDDLFATTPTNPWTGLSTQPGTNLSADIPYNGSLTITRTATGVNIVSVLNGVTVSVSDESSAFTAFDTISINGTGGFTANSAFDNIVVTYTPVPEPSAGWLLGGAGLAFALIRRPRPRAFGAV